MTVLPHLLAAADETSKLPFYVGGGALALWAVVVSALGLTRPDFPSGSGGGRAVVAISVLLVLAATSTAVLTA